MAAAAVKAMSSQDGDRQTQSPSPLSFWTKVSPEPVTSPTRTVFTIVGDNAENSPRPPKPEFSQLEAKGMISLSSQWDQGVTDRDGQVTSSMERGDQQKPVKRVNFSSHCDFEPTRVNIYSRSVNDYEQTDDELVIVTDKDTQTEQPWPFSCAPSAEQLNANNYNSSTHHFKPTNSTTVNTNTSNGSSSDSSTTTTSVVTDDNQDDIVGNNSNNGATAREDPNVSEAPTLKVEYVGKVWDAYINDFLLASDHISQAAIYDRASKSCIACSLQFAMSQEEFDHLLTCVNCLPVAYKQGISINNRRYKTVLADGRRGLMAKGEERDGCSVCQTRTLVLVALHDRASKGRRCNDELMRLGDFFWAKGL